MSRVEILVGDCLQSMRSMPDQSVHCCVTSPPYFGLRDYGHDGQIGLEPHEHIFLLTKEYRYSIDMGAVREPSVDGGGRNKRSVWNVPASNYKGAHFATFPPDLIEPCILAGCPAGGTVLDPFGGAGTTGLVAKRHGRSAILCELNPEYAALAESRVSADERAKSGVREPGLFPEIEAVA